MHGLVVYMTEELLFTWDLSLENSGDSYLCFQVALIHSMSYFCFLYWSPSLSLCDSVSSNIDEVLSTNFLGDFNIHHKNWLTNPGGTGRHGELYYNFPIWIDLFQMVNFPRWFLDCAFLNFFPDASITENHNGFLSMGKFVSCCFVSYHWLCNKLKIRCSVSSHSLCLFLCWLGGMVFKIIWQMFLARVSLNSVLLLLVLNFESGFRLELMYICLIVSIRSNVTHLHGF